MSRTSESRIEFTKETIKNSQEDLKTFWRVGNIPHIASFLVVYLTAFYFGQWVHVQLFPEEPSLYDLVNIFSNSIGIPFTLFLISFFSFFYYFRFPSIEKYKTTNIPWPWVEDIKAWKVTFKSAILFTALNEGIMFPLCYLVMNYLFWPLTRSSDLPSLFTFTWQYIVMAFLEDFFFYWTHRLLHLPCLYRFHKRHHSHADTTIFSNSNDHPLDYCLGNAIPVLMGLVVLKGSIHVSTVNTFILFRMWQAWESHSGYEFPWNPFVISSISANTAYHSYHHIKNMGNYGDFLTIWDTIFGTNKEYLEEMKSKKLD